mmetsp:Transcript_47174/g.78268  ORF Transcript_47174/g.78268 Transcript_47174/m.78268 type:complete len:80 (+) Transcript_47174:1062-1301(+)
MHSSSLVSFHLGYDPDACYNLPIGMHALVRYQDRGSMAVVRACTSIWPYACLKHVCVYLFIGDLSADSSQLPANLDVIP